MSPDTADDRLKKLDQKVMPLDETADAEIEESANFRIPPEHRYGISDIEE